MQDLNTIVVIEFLRDPDEPYTKLWKRLRGVVLEQPLTLPAAVLAPDNLLELAVDGEPRRLRISHLRWEQDRQTLHVHAVPSEDAAAQLRAAGLVPWRPWLRRQAVEGFLASCRSSGWVVRNAGARPAAVAPAASSRIEPTL